MGIIVERKDYKLNEVFEFEGVKLKPIKAKGCDGCYFEFNDACMNVFCTPNGRKDKTGVKIILAATEAEPIDTTNDLGNIEPEENNGGNTDYYDLPSGAKVLQDLIEHKEMNFAIGNIFKAAYRLGNCIHSDAIRDLNKIIWFAKREIDRIKKVK